MKFHELKQTSLWEFVGRFYLVLAIPYLLHWYFTGRDSWIGYFIVGAVGIHAVF